MAAGFRIYRLLCTSPPDLDPEREVLESSVARFNEEVSMAEGILFAAASLRTTFRADAHSGPVTGNIRTVDFFVQIFGERPADPAFRGFVDLALDCVADPAIPLRAAAVLFRGREDRDPAVEALRESWVKDFRCRVLEFRSNDIQEIMREMLSAWYEQCRTAAAVQKEQEELV